MMCTATIVYIKKKPKSWEVQLTCGEPAEYRRVTSFYVTLNHQHFEKCWKENIERKKKNVASVMKSSCTYLMNTFLMAVSCCDEILI